MLTCLCKNALLFLFFIGIVFEAYSGDSLNYISGTIVYRKGKTPLYGAVVLILKTKLAGVTDDNGRFTMVIPDSLVGRKVTLEFRYVGCYSLRKKLHLKKLPKFFQVELYEDVLNLKKVILISNSERKSYKLKW